MIDVNYRYDAAYTYGGEVYSDVLTFEVIEGGFRFTGMTNVDGDGRTMEGSFFELFEVGLAGPYSEVNEKGAIVSGGLALIVAAADSPQDPKGPRSLEAEWFDNEESGSWSFVRQSSPRS